MQVDELEKLRQALCRVEPYGLAEQCMNGDPEKTVHFVSIMKNHKSKDAERGAIVKALALGSRQLYLLEPLAKVIEHTLDRIFERCLLNSVE